MDLPMFEMVLMKSLSESLKSGRLTCVALACVTYLRWIGSCYLLLVFISCMIIKIKLIKLKMKSAEPAFSLGKDKKRKV